MTAAALKPATVLRTAAGEPPLGPNGMSFALDQGETFEHDNARYRNPSTTIAVLELDNGKWLARPPGFMVDGDQHDNRALALDVAVGAMIARAERFMANAEGEGTHWSPEFGEAVIKWARALLERGIAETGEDMDARVKPGAEDITDVAAINFSSYAAIDAGASISDPVVRYLVEEHGKRKQFPAKHTFSMTTDVAEGRIVSVATCKCGHAVRFGSNDVARMNAAIEAHWRRFPEEPTVDGRGEPIVPGDGSRIPQAKKPRKRRAPAISGEDGAGASPQQTSRGDGAGGHPNAGDTPDLANAPLPEPSSAASHAAGDGSTLHPYPDWYDAAHAEWMESDEGRRFEALRWVVNGWGGDVDSELLRDLIGLGYAHATASDVLVTDDGQAWLDAMQAKISSDGGGGGESPMPAATSQGQQSGAATGPSDDPAPGELPPGAGNLSAADRSDWEGLYAIIHCKPVDDVVRADLIRRGLVHDIGGLHRWALTEVGYARAETLKPLFWREPPAEEFRARFGNNEPAQICAGEAILAEMDDLALDWPSYDAFLEEKVITAPLRGIEVPRDALHPYLKPHCKDLTVWALRLGCAAIFASFGLHKTAMQLEWCRQLIARVGGSSLCVVPLGVRHGFIKEAQNLGMDVRFIRTNEEHAALLTEGVVHFLTNYESIREGKLDPNLFGAVSLDEASVLRSYGSKTFQEFLPLFAKVAFKLVATATPSPNRYKELIHYSGFLGVMDTGLALTRFFQRNSEKAGDLTLYPHKQDEFWMWIHSWAAFLQKPSELGYSDDGYELPPLTIRWHEVAADHSKAEPERDGQTVLFRKGAASLQDAARSRRDSLPARMAKMLELLAEDPESHRILWHDLEAEREAIEAAVEGVVAITGSGMDIDERERHLHDFEEGRTKYFATKPILSGSGSNFQYHCHKAVYVGLPGEGYKFNDWIQSVYRLQRFGQAHPVEIDIIYSEDMRAGREALEAKWALDTAMRARMSEIIAAHGLNTLPLRDALLRSMGVKRVEIRGANFIAINNDAVAECQAWPENSVDLMVTSIPFSNHYEYSPSYRDFGHTDDNGHFWSQMDFLSVELLRMLKPGRLACIHVKDRVLFGSVTGEGVPTISPFHAEAIMHYRAHGFQFMGMITVVTDVVRENNQTYRLGWSENAKDSTKMGVGSPEYVLLMRKPQSDRTRSYADMPVTKVNARLDGTAADSETEGYSRARWQLDAHALWRSSGNRLLMPDEFASLDTKGHAKLFSKISAERIYNYEAHVRIGENLERQGILPAQFMAIAPGSAHPDVWHDVQRMRTLNMLQQKKGQEQHLCPLQFDIVDRLIERYSNKGELVFDPFGGLMTVPYRSVLKGRKGAATELSATYYLDGVQYLRQAEEQMATPELFDLVEFAAPGETIAETGQGDPANEVEGV